MARTIIGLDIGAAAIKAVVVSARFNHREVVGQHIIPLAPSETPEEHLQNIKDGLQQLKDLGLPPIGATIVAAFPDSGLNSHIMELPFKENKKIDTTLNGELDFQQTIDNVDDLAASWTHAKQIVDRPEGPYPVLVTTVKQERLVSLLAMLKDCGFDPQMVLHPAVGWPLTCLGTTKKTAEEKQIKENIPVDPADAPTVITTLPDLEAAAAAQNELPATEEENLSMMIDIGARRTNIAIYTAKGELLLVRTINFGVAQNDQAIAEALNVSLAEAAAIRETEGHLNSENENEEYAALYPLLKQHFALLSSQLRLTINRLPKLAGKLNILLTGGGSKQKGLPSFLETELGLPVFRADSARLFANSLDNTDQLATEYQTATSMTLAALGNYHGGLLDFRRGPFAYQGELSWIKGHVIRLLTGSAAVFAFALISLIVQLHLYNDLDAKLSQQFCRITKQTIKKEICDPRAAVSALNTPTGPQGNTLPSYSAVDQFVALSLGVPSDLKVVFSDITISSDKILIKGTCEDFETLDKLVDALSKLSCVTEAKQTRSSKSKDEVEFNITMKYECATGVNPLTEVG